MIAKSIRWQLLFWLGIFLVCLALALGVTGYQLHRIRLFEDINAELERRMTALSHDVRDRWRLPLRYYVLRDRPVTEFEHDSPRFPFEPREHGREGFEMQPPSISDATLSLFGGPDRRGFYFVVWSHSGTVLKRSTNAPAVEPLPDHVDPRDTRTHFRTIAGSREAFHFTERNECVLAGRPIAADLASLNEFQWRLAAGGLAILAFVLGGGWLIAGRVLRPIRQISAAAGRISAGNLSERIDATPNRNELDDLVRVLNSAFDRVEAAFAQQRQFIADAAHELRTPIAILISEAQTVLARERSVPEYREAVEACLATAQQMRQLAQSLLELARFDAGQEKINRTALDLAECARACVELIRPLAAGRGIRLACDLAPAPALGDAERCSQVILNLLTNAIFYNRDGGEIRVSTEVNHESAILAVEDTGQGIEEEDLPHVFDRFYRADKARARENNCSGLGLAISKAIVDAHQGSLEVFSKPGVGTTFRIRLPLRPA